MVYTKVTVVYIYVYIFWLKDQFKQEFVELALCKLYVNHHLQNSLQNQILNNV